MQLGMQLGGAGFSLSIRAQLGRGEPVPPPCARATCALAAPLQSAASGPRDRPGVCPPSGNGVYQDVSMPSPALSNFRKREFRPELPNRPPPNAERAPRPANSLRDNA